MKTQSLLLFTTALFGSVVMAAPYDPCAGKVTFGVAMGSMGHCSRSIIPAKRSAEKREVDGDDAVVYAWKVPEERREVDGDDAVVYAWKVPEEKN